MRTVILMFLLLCGSVWAQDTALPLVGVQARGFIMDDDVDTVYFEHLLDADDTDAAYVVGALQKAGRRQTTMLFKPETAERIAHEVEPYLTLFERGRKFSEDIRINPTISISLTSRNNMQLTIRNTSEKSELHYRGEKLLRLVKGWYNAEEISRTWLGIKLGSALPAPDFQQPDFSSFDPFRFDADEQDEPAAAAVSLSDLAADYAVNEYAAEAKYGKYLNQTLTVSGTVKAVARDAVTGKPRILFNQSIGNTPITCLLDNVMPDEVAAIEPDQPLTVEARWMGGTSDGAASNLVGGSLVW